MKVTIYGLRLTIVIMLLTFLFHSGYSQNSLPDTIPAAASSGNSQHQTGLAPHKTDYHLQMGTQFTTSSWGSGFSTFVTPSLSYNISKKLSIGGGISIVNTTFNGKYYNPFSTGELSYNGNFTTATVFVSGQYLLNDKITITGSAYKQFNIMGNVPGYPGYKNNDPQGMYLNVDYKIANNVHLQAGFGYSRGYNRCDPYNMFGNDPFNDTFGNPFYHPVR